MRAAFTGGCRGVPTITTEAQRAQRLSGLSYQKKTFYLVKRELSVSLCLCGEKTPHFTRDFKASKASLLNSDAWSGVTAT